MDLKFVAENRCIGIYIDGVWEHWATLGPQYYVMAHLVWNPRQDARAILDDYYRRGFGPAADDVQAYYTLLERAREAFVEQHDAQATVVDFPKLYTAELLAQAADHLDRAAARVIDEPDRYRQRVEFVRAGLTFTGLVVENIVSMTEYWRQPEESIADTVRENWRAIEVLCQQHPYAVHWGPLRPQTPRMRGLHPDYPDPRWKRRIAPPKADGLDRD